MNDGALVQKKIRTVIGHKTVSMVLVPSNAPKKTKVLMQRESPPAIISVSDGHGGDVASKLTIPNIRELRADIFRYLRDWLLTNV